MGYTLYNRRGSGGFVVEAALALAEAPFELVELESKPGTPLRRAFAPPIPGANCRCWSCRTGRP